MKVEKGTRLPPDEPVLRDVLHRLGLRARAKSPIPTLL